MWMATRRVIEAETVRPPALEVQAGKDNLNSAAATIMNSFKHNCLVEGLVA